MSFQPVGPMDHQNYLHQVCRSDVDDFSSFSGILKWMRSGFLFFTIYFPINNHQSSRDILQYLKDKLVIGAAFPDACGRLSAMAFTMAFRRIRAMAVFRRGVAVARATNPRPSTRIRDKCDWPSIDKIVSALCVCVMCSHKSEQIPADVERILVSSYGSRINADTISRSCTGG